MIYGAAAVMGIAPSEVDRMSLAQWAAVAKGWTRAHGESDKPDPMTPERARELLRRHR